MNSWDLTRQLQSLQALIKKTSVASSQDLELQSHWARYLCVLATGFLENAIPEIFADFIRTRSSQPVSNFALRALDRRQNPTPERLFQTAAGFDSAWAHALRDFLAQDGRKEALESLINQRHLIAHGKHSAITVAGVRIYLQKVVEVIEFLERQISS